MASTRIAVRLWTWAAVLRVLKRLVPLETLVRMMHRKPARWRRSRRLQEQLESYLAMAGRFPLRPPANCLERSLGAYRLLCGAAARPELVIGVRRSAANDVLGHVWVTVEGRPFAEQDDQLAGYVPIVTFDADARRHSSGASDDLPRGIL